MKLHSTLFLFALAFLSPNLVCMEAQEKITKESVNITLGELRENFNNNGSTLSFNTSKTVQRIIDAASDKLNKKRIKKEKLKNIQEEIQKGITILDKALKQKNVEENFIHLAQQIKDEQKQQQKTTAVQPEPPSPSSPNRPKRSEKKQRFPSIKTTGLPVNYTEFEVENGQGESSNHNTLAEGSLPKAIHSQQSQKPQSLSWLKILSYVSGTGVCTGIGLYSYYKLKPEQWYRPFIIGLSCFGTFSFGYFGYKDWMLQKKKFETM